MALHVQGKVFICAKEENAETQFLFLHLTVWTTYVWRPCVILVLHHLIGGYSQFYSTATQFTITACQLLLKLKQQLCPACLSAAEQFLKRTSQFRASKCIDHGVNSGITHD